jgi:hypothetical protein
LQASVKSSVSPRTIQRVTMDGFKNAPAVPRRLYADFCNKICHKQTHAPQP